MRPQQMFAVLRAEFAPRDAVAFGESILSDTSWESYVILVQKDDRCSPVLPFRYADRILAGYIGLWRGGTALLVDFLDVQLLMSQLVPGAASTPRYAVSPLAQSYILLTSSPE